MGCCASTNKSAKPNKSGRISNSTTAAAAKRGGVSKSPPPSHSHLEEETVKEVLSETPKPPSPPIPKFQSKHESPFIKSAPLLQEKRQNGVVYKPPFLAFAAASASDDLSEASEICSTLSESVSATTSVTEKRENNNGERRADSRQRSPARLRNRPFSGELQREKTVGRSPGRKPEPSPGRARPGPGPGSGYGKRRENGESSGRRSRSPVTRGESGLGRAPSARRTGKSPGRVGPGSGEKIRKLESGDSKWPAAPTNAGNDELLENPLVSLECFIFL